MDHPLSSGEIIDMLPGIKIVTYDELHAIDNIHELLKPNGAFILLYMLKPGFGHWVCVFTSTYGAPVEGISKSGVRYAKYNYDKDNCINFFDPYGWRPDSRQVFQNVDPSFIKKMNQDYTWLTNLLKHSGYQHVTYNKYRLQGKNVSTCGRFCILRIWMRNFSNKEFAYFMRNHYFDDHQRLTPDELSVILTTPRLKNIRARLQYR